MTLKRSKVVTVFILATLCLSIAQAFSKPALAVESSRPSPVGEQRTIVILIEFTDLKHTVSKYLVRNIFLVEMSKYFMEVSYGQTWITGDVTDWYAIPEPSSNYRWEITPSRGDSQKALKTITTAIHVADKDVDFLKYQRVVVLVAGKLGNSMTERISPLVNVLTDDGVRITAATLCSWGDGTSIYIHEFSHQLGLPDFYDLRDAAPQFGLHVGFWDLMDMKPYSPQVGFCAWSRIRLGWIPAERIRTVNIGQTTTVQIDHLELGNQTTYALKIPLSGSTYYLVEVRQKLGYDSVLPDYGVLIYWVDDSKAVQTLEDRPVRVKDANPSTDTLDDATFDIRSGKNPIFIDQGNGLAVVVLQPIGLSYKVHVTTSAKGQMSLDTWKIITETNATLSNAFNEGRTVGLDEAEAMLRRAIVSFDGGDYEGAAKLASQAKTVADKAAKPTSTTVVRPTSNTISGYTTSANVSGMLGFTESYGIVAAMVMASATMAILYVRRSRRTTD